ncbi:hypothetical protein [Roseospira goensis]|uniref:Uncharacterized protein n=1 Tax=Roseospira goensis TaxID=391922 RepID=A0A7W6WKG5_9PROT|nr:hypothetical protein [Roseospira goensis]MBB4285568.1 hypothetical protein [Roseospira goensis]
MRIATRAWPAGWGPAGVAMLAMLLVGGPAQAQQELVGAWVGQGTDPMSGATMQVEYSLMPDGTFQKSFALQMGYASGYDWIAGVWFTEGPWLRFEVRDHYSTHQGSRGPLPAGELWAWRLEGPGTLVLTHALCVQQGLTRPDCVLTLQRAR